MRRSTACVRIPSFGNVTQVESTANMRGQNFVAGLNFQIPARRMMLFANYAWLNQENDADGAVQPAGQQLRPRRASGGRWPACRATSSAGCSALPLIKQRPAGAQRRRPHAARPTTSPPDRTTTATPSSTIVRKGRPQHRTHRHELGRRRAPQLRLRLRPAPPAGGGGAGGGQPVMIVQRVGGASGSDIGGIVRRRRRRQADPLRAVRLGLEPVQHRQPDRLLGRDDLALLRAAHRGDAGRRMTSACGWDSRGCALTWEMEDGREPSISTPTSALPCR